MRDPIYIVSQAMMRRCGENKHPDLLNQTICCSLTLCPFLVALVHKLFTKWWFWETSVTAILQIKAHTAKTHKTAREKKTHTAETHTARRGHCTKEKDTPC